MQQLPSMYFINGQVLEGNMEKVVSLIYLSDVGTSRFSFYFYSVV